MRFPLLLVLLLLLACTVATAAGGGTYFVVQCGYGHTNTDDPIKDLNGTSHSHDYTGSNDTHFGSSYQSMQAAGTTCGTPNDSAGYWQPTPVLNGVFQHPLYARIYYGCGTVSCNLIQTPPANMMLIGGSATATGPNQKQERFDCGQNTPVVSYPYDCSAYYAAHPGLTDSSDDGVVAWAVLPQWWDGFVGSTSTVHGGAQPSDFSYTKTAVFAKPIPLITIRYHLGKAWDGCLPKYGQDPKGTPTCLTFGYTAPSMALQYWQEHGDFWNTWNQPALDTEVGVCLRTQPNGCKSFDGTH